MTFDVSRLDSSLQSALPVPEVLADANSCRAHIELEFWSLTLRAGTNQIRKPYGRVSQTGL